MEKLLKISEVAELLGISAGTIRNKVRPNADRPFPIPHYRIGGSIRFNPEDIEKYLQEALHKNPKLKRT